MFIDLCVSKLLNGGMGMLIFEMTFEVELMTYHLFILTWAFNIIFQYNQLIFKTWTSFMNSCEQVWSNFRKQIFRYWIIEQFLKIIP